MTPFLSSVSLLLLIVTTIEGSSRFNGTCPDQSSCPDEDSTCCKLISGHFGCCPLKNAVCCSDGYHCCPSGSQCNNEEGTCDLFWDPDVPNIAEAGSALDEDQLAGVTEKTCPDKTQKCDEDETCCKLESGGYGCCSYDGAVCCSDGVHCCPHGSQCDITHEKCTREMVKLQLTGLKPLQEPKVVSIYGAKNTDCPGGGYQCPDGNTCCKLKEGDWGCCPLENAVCCPDQVHCCPNNYTCEPSGCKPKTLFLPFIHLMNKRRPDNY